MPVELIQFPDRLVSYDRFISDIAAKVSSLINTDFKDPEFITQRRAFEIFGRRNVERWRKQGKIQPFKRPGKLEYRTADLRLLQRTVQDYFKE